MRRALLALSAVMLLAGCGHKGKFAELGECRLKAAQHGVEADKADIITACMASKGYRIDSALPGCSADGSAPIVMPGIFHPNPEDERCYVNH